LLDKEREPLEHIVNSAFPLLEALMQKFLASYNEQTGVLIKVVLKIFHHCMHLILPKYLLDPAKFDVWMQYLKILLDNPIPPELSSPTIDE